MLQKYKLIFGDDNIDYEFCSFMQHAKSYSPLLDLTSNPCIALSFAVKSSNDLNNYMKIPSSLYEFSFSKLENIDEEDPNLFWTHMTYISNQKLRLCSKINDKLLCMCTYKDFETHIYILNKKSNDRMKYQKGAFLYINRVVIINGIMLMPINMGKITKYKISPNQKNKINETIKKHYPFYDSNHLMNPYLFFED